MSYPRSLPDRVCPSCAATFRPRKSSTRYCSRVCMGVGLQTQKAGKRPVQMRAGYEAWRAGSAGALRLERAMNRGVSA